MGTIGWWRVVSIVVWRSQHCKLCEPWSNYCWTEVPQQKKVQGVAVWTTKHNSIVQVSWATFLWLNVRFHRWKIEFCICHKWKWKFPVQNTRPGSRPEKTGGLLNGHVWNPCRPNFQQKCPPKEVQIWVIFHQGQWFLGPGPHPSEFTQTKTSENPSILANFKSACRLALWRLRCSFHRTSIYPCSDQAGPTCMNQFTNPHTTQCTHQWHNNRQGMAWLLFSVVGIVPANPNTSQKNLGSASSFTAGKWKDKPPPVTNRCEGKFSVQNIQFNEREISLFKNNKTKWRKFLFLIST